MKKTLIAILLALTLVASLALIACEGDSSETNPSSGDIQTNSTEHETSAATPDNGNGVLGVGADTDDSWGPIQTN